MEIGELVKKFADAEMQLTKDALEFLQTHPNSDALADHVLGALISTQHKPFLVTSDLIRQILEKGSVSVMEEKAQPEVEHPSVEFKPSELTHKKFKPLAAEYKGKIKVLKDITSKSYSKGQIEDFVKLFNDRFRKLAEILRARIGLEAAMSLSGLPSRSEHEEVAIIGMVASKRQPSTGTVFIELEDPTGATATVIVPRRKQDKELHMKAERVVVDEVIGVVGQKASRGRSTVFARDIFWPGIPFQRERRRAEEPFCAVMISDLHIGSEQFLENLFYRFVRWLRGEEGGESKRELASRVKYVIIAGDVVDGIGVYPEQQSELLIHDIYKQYGAAAELLSQIPEHIEVIIIPGNHDAARPSEPQPAIPEDIAAPLYERGFHMLGNPSLISLDGVYFLLYHGRSFDDLIPAVPGLSRLHPTKPMIELLKRRHLAPIYGGRTAIAPEPEDLMVIDEIPDVFHCGHVHRFGAETYRNITVVNSATFQAKTQYMQKMGIDPTPGYVPVFDLQTHELVVMNFAPTA